MGVKIERAAGWAYFGWSVAVLVVWLFITFGPVWQRYDLPEREQASFPLQWTEYVQIFLASLLVAAFYGCFTLIFLLNRKRAGRMSIVFISFAVVIGWLSWVLGVFSLVLAHADCADDCVAYVPDRVATQTIDSLLLPFALLPPTVFLIVVIAGRVVQRRRVHVPA